MKTNTTNIRGQGDASIFGRDSYTNKYKTRGRGARGPDWTLKKKRRFIRRSWPYDLTSLQKKKGETYNQEKGRG